MIIFACGTERVWLKCFFKVTGDKMQLNVAEILWDYWDTSCIIVHAIVSALNKFYVHLYDI